jgi:hypothetical protein
MTSEGSRTSSSRTRGSEQADQEAAEAVPHTFIHQRLGEMNDRIDRLERAMDEAEPLSGERSAASGDRL